tara:strand:+ start:904 stop:1080 length:177 start_codon:yes stop_codon:yes gene_type:complete
MRLGIERMTKKDFQAVANAIANATTNESTLAIVLADTFQAAYPRFDRVRFLKACEIKT